MKLDYAFFATGAEMTVDGRLNVFGGEIGGMKFPGFPAFAKFFLVLKFVDEPQNIGAHKITIVCALRGSGPLPGHVKETTVETKLNPNNPSEAAGAIVIAEISIGFPNAGIYEFQVSADDVQLRAIPLYISLASAEEIGQQAQAQ